MTNMAHAPVPQLHVKPMPKTGKKVLQKTGLSDMAQMDPIKRLLKRPNITIKTIHPRQEKTSCTDPKVKIEVENETDTSLTKSSDSQLLPFVHVKVEKLDIEEDEADLLSAEIKGRPEISLLPLKCEKKTCNHDEPCENIVCHVAIQQCVDRDNTSPMLAVNIEEDEINAPVLKHCKNESCDALSIDHNRCRRALIKLYRCDRSFTCDICGLSLKSWKSRIVHKNCTRGNEYRHNEADGAQVLKERMREREIQMVEAAKAKKNNYSDPIVGPKRAMETLRNNRELLIIPKPTPIPPPALSLNATFGAHSTRSMNTVQSMFRKILPSIRNVPRMPSISSIPTIANMTRMPNISSRPTVPNIPNIPIVLPRQTITINKRPCSNETGATASKQVKLSEAPNTRLIPTFCSVPAVQFPPQNQYITIAGTAQSNVQPIAINNWILSQPQIVTTAHIQPAPVLGSICVLPVITQNNLTAQPLLMNQTQSVPQVCIVANNTLSSTTEPNPQPALARSGISNSNRLGITMPKKAKYRRKKRNWYFKKRPRYQCSYCMRSFVTEWYYKSHMARHNDKMFTCKICRTSFTNRLELQNHVGAEHDTDLIPCTICDAICSSYKAFDRHIKSHPEIRPNKCSECGNGYASAMSLIYHRRMIHGISTCKFCHIDMPSNEMYHHVRTIHKGRKEIEKREEQFRNSHFRKSVETGDSARTMKTQINNRGQEDEEAVQTKEGDEEGEECDDEEDEEEEQEVEVQEILKNCDLDQLLETEDPLKIVKTENSCFEGTVEGEHVLKEEDEEAEMHEVSGCDSMEIKTEDIKIEFDDIN